ncbi:hypothetical protein ACFPT7_10005 [Acidicapsa dinghuensis]|uniref:Uncharacterized protein n=1 Tax=Acidicapsa dinghuensis TaxID=2218256 RepID=A0ABW1EEU6_9BACT|nr:hypothetical protein [Acidicapsa dinghuensis]
MEAHLDQQESMFAEPAELESQEYVESFLGQDQISEPEPILDEDSEALFAGSEQDADSGYSAVAAKPVEGEAVATEAFEAASMPETKTVEPPSAAEAKHSEELTPLSADDFSALEERILRAVKLVQTEREARIAAEDRAAQLQSQVDAQNPAIERLQSDIELLRLEREQVRQRVERLLAQLDALEL